ncbi:hypothetical protein DFJ74DRAFT_650604 [Hyaloraphidium curvatum]|nr:hypothetical protein DFJ74DRAFT_650604 [Hyaloraphidium curvatum]
MLVFAQPGLQGAPLFFAGAEDPEFPHGSVPRVLANPRDGKRCVVVGNATRETLLPHDTEVEEACRGAHNPSHDIMWWVKTRIKTSAGMHEYTRGEHFEEMAQWLAMWTEREVAKRAAGKSGTHQARPPPGLPGNAAGPQPGRESVWAMSG